MKGQMHCPLCAESGARPFHRDRRREYLRCRECALVFVPRAYYLAREQERAEYDLHRNELDDPGYRAFLSRLARPLQARLPVGAHGLDFGCGPGPALAAMLRESGLEVKLFDPYYYPDRAALQGQYQFITATEVVEHLHHPGRELARLWELLLPGGYLGVMTKLVIDAQAFANWHYKNDPTHVCFFSVATWVWWADSVGAALERVAADAVLLHKL